ncbi:hypothetical protein KC363_g2981 [Hortaea werneckii]|uniref:Uncharacterized protein n=1 Tax=Hortaea werneckii TaxID=91943 RepID=A0A3M7FUV1_HORWE|nr:hypothetical protein KC361_g4000 [Hortaea werneckii]KAI6880891.1 hypothetical protein KC325_g6910 [Hortaea werneckii]KAI6989156.1 hypothetical protein KC359_g7381 [Hortaea werneckii]KAI7087011.1 hypothetical protein KC356_g4564 [Hortaea werneckii]KAI7142732.1 hypothetical protein KC344_g6915 [Hortaea werneckii]
MSRAVKESLQRMKSWVTSTASRVNKIASGQGDVGTRAAPTQAGSNDTEIGSRLDYGDKSIKDGKEFRRYKFQINKQAANSTLRDLANKDSHKVWAQADVPLDSKSPEEAVEKLFEDLEKDLSSRK